MGSFIIKPRTRIVAANALLTGAAAAVITTARLIAKARSTAAAPRTASVDRMAGNPAWIESVPTLRETFTRAEQGHLRAAKQLGTDSVAAMKSAAFAALAETPFVLDSDTALTAEIRALDTAPTLAAATAAREQILAKAAAIHSRVHSTAILRATERAFLRAGLTNVQHQPSLGTTQRIEATANGGHVVVGEIGQDGSMATEVLGACGAAQEALHDAIEAALEAEGVHATGKVRKPTGGVATTETAREFLRRKIGAKQRETDRARRLNQQRAQTRRR